MIMFGSIMRATPLLSAALLLASCAAVPDLGPAPTLRTPESIAASESLSPVSGRDWPSDAWWAAYSDPQLTRLIEEGLADSPDVAAAAARLRQAQGYAQRAGAALAPTLDVEGSASFDKQSYNQGFPKEFLPQGWLDGGSVAARGGFDLDLWGRNRAQLAAATSEAEAAAVEARYAQLALATTIADSYAELARLYSEYDIRQRSLEIRLETRELVQNRLTMGLDTRGDLRQAEANALSARADVAAVKEAIALRKNELAALVGAGPDRALTIGRPSLQDLESLRLPEGVTTELVTRRADIVAARARAMAEASRIKAARADFYPSIRLEALIGLQSLGLDRLFKSDSVYGSVGPAISLPIFHGGELSGQYRVARATYDEAVAEYNKTVIAAYQEVADAVTSRRMLAERLDEASAALEASEDAYEVARLRYEGGLSNYLDLLLVEDQLLVARQRVADLDARGFTLDVALIRALGGGFTDIKAPAPTTSGSISKDDRNG